MALFIFTIFTIIIISSSSNISIIIFLVVVEDLLVLYHVCVCVLSPCMYVHHMHVSCLRYPAEDVGSPGTGVVDGCELSCGCWELKQDPL